MLAYFALAAAQLAGSYQQADLIKQSGDVQNSVAEMNAKFADLDAYNASREGLSESARYATVADQTIGSQRGAFAGANVDVNYGTAKDVQQDTKLTAMMNTLELQRRGREKALGFQQQALNTRLGGTMSQLQSQLDAGTAQNKGFLSAASTLVTGYERDQSTGVGQQKLSGSNDTPTYSKPGSRQAAPGEQKHWFYGSDGPSAQPTVGSLIGAQPDSTSAYKSLYDSGLSGDAPSYFHSSNPFS